MHQGKFGHCERRQLNELNEIRPEIIAQEFNCHFVLRTQLVLMYIQSGVKHHPYVDRKISVQAVLSGPS